MDIDCLAVEAKRTIISGSTMTYIRNNTLPGSMLRGMALGICAWDMSTTCSKEHANEHPSGLWPDLRGAMFEKEQEDKAESFGVDIKDHKKRDVYHVEENSRAYA